MINKAYRILGPALITLAAGATEPPKPIPLPPPDLVGSKSLEQVLDERRSVREFSSDSLTLSELGQLLWAAQGITSDNGWRTAPSAGALYPLDVYIAVKRVAGLTSGVYRYIPGLPDEHWLELVREGDPSPDLNHACGQACIAEGAVGIIIVAIAERTAKRYGERAERYAILEAGHAAQNVLLQAEARDLGAVPVGAFHDELIQELTGSSGMPLYVISVGKKDKK
ncbi:MAG: SagB/ThcOx family dehydrogenase [Calditrichota bacterium]